MYNLLSLFTGIIIAIMVAINGQLSAEHGVFTSTVIIHIVGTVFAAIVILLSRKKFIWKSNCPAWAYLGGVIGVLTTVFNNFACGKISITSIVALGLLGQTVTALLFDYFGILGTKKQTFNPSSLIGLLFAAAGIFIMFDTSSGVVVYAIVLSICAGITIVLSRNVNAVLANEIGALQGSFVNHVVGLPLSILFLLIMGRGELGSSFAVNTASLWIYIGGAFGVLLVMLYNIIVPKVPAFYVTLLTFVGQVFMGLLIDILLDNGYSGKTIWGGILVSARVGVNMLLDYFRKRK